MNSKFIFFLIVFFLQASVSFAEETSELTQTMVCQLHVRSSVAGQGVISSEHVRYAVTRGSEDVHMKTGRKDLEGHWAVLGKLLASGKCRRPDWSELPSCKVDGENKLIIYEKNEKLLEIVVDTSFDRFIPYFSGSTKLLMTNLVTFGICKPVF